MTEVIITVIARGGRRGHRGDRQVSRHPPIGHQGLPHLDPHPVLTERHGYVYADVAPARRASGRHRAVTWRWTSNATVPRPALNARDFQW